MKDSGATRSPRRGKGGRLPNRKAAQKSRAATTAVIAPAGGVQKPTKRAKPARDARVPAIPVAPSSGESKISVSNLPGDVEEPMIKDYFASTAGPVKRVIRNYNQHGKFNGSCVIIFSKPDAAAKAAKSDGTKVDGKPLRIEILVSGKQVVPPKSLADRVSAPKNAARETQKKNQKKEGPKPAANGEKKKEGAKKSGRAGRPKKKTAEELDAEMQDYFGGGEAPAATTNGAAQPAAVTTNGGDAMDEVL